jgi:Pyridoxal-dependent decarboxylase, pyridoxal binding domain
LSELRSRRSRSIKQGCKLIDRHTRLQLPASWPRSLRPEALNRMDHPTPFLACDLETARERYAHLTAALPGMRCFYAVKCNCEPELLSAFDQLGSSFEIASCAELQMLQKLGVDPERLLYSNTVKPAAHIAESFAAGLWRYAFDSEGELYKLAQHAPGAAVYVRLRVDDSTSLFPLSRKFGAEAQEARALLLLARSLGLRPYGVTFHVGSQCTTTTAWRQAIAAVGRLLSRLQGDGISLEMLNLGGGFPARYVEGVPSIDQIANTIESALHELLPYRPPLLAVEPGRYLVAVAATNVVAWTGYAGMRAEVAAADPRGAAMTWYMVAVAAIEAAGTATAALLPTGPTGLVSGTLLAAVIAAYGACLLPTWLVAAGAQVGRAQPAAHPTLRGSQWVPRRTRSGPRGGDPVLGRGPRWGSVVQRPGGRRRISTASYRPGPLAGLLASGGLVMLLGSGPTLLAAALATLTFTRLAWRLRGDARSRAGALAS